jgi:hypothetical protein
MLQNNLFKSVIHRAPKLDYFSKAVNIPNISLPSVPVASPFTTIKEQGDHISFAPLELTFTIDANLKNYKEIVDWMTEIGFPESYEQYGKTKPVGVKESLLSDIDVFVFSGKNNPTRAFKFINAWPTDLGGININIENETITYAECSVTFEYDLFTVG